MSGNRECDRRVMQQWLRHLVCTYRGGRWAIWDGVGEYIGETKHDAFLYYLYRNNINHPRGQTNDPP